MIPQTSNGSGLNYRFCRFDVGQRMEGEREGGNMKDILSIHHFLLYHFYLSIT